MSATFFCRNVIPKCDQSTCVGTVRGKMFTKFALKWLQYLAVNPTSRSVAKIETFYTHSFCTHLCSKLKDAKWAQFALKSKQKTGICINNCFLMHVSVGRGISTEETGGKVAPFLSKKKQVFLSIVYMCDLCYGQNCIPQLPDLNVSDFSGNGRLGQIIVLRLFYSLTWNKQKNMII